MKGKKNNRKKIFISLILILVGFVYLYFNGFSYPGNIHISQAYLIKEGADGRWYLLDEGHERLLCIDKQNKVLYSVENPQDAGKRTLYIDDFCVDKSGNLYLQTSLWDGMHVSEEVILSYDSAGKQKEVIRQWDYSSEWVYKHKIYGISMYQDKLQYVILNKNQIELTGDKKVEITYPDADTRISDCVLVENRLYILDKNGKIFEKEDIYSTEEIRKIFDVNKSRFSDGIPYKLSISQNGKIFYTDIRNRMVVMLDSDDYRPVPIVKNTDTLTVWTMQSEEELIFTADFEAGQIWQTDGTLQTEIRDLHTDGIKIALWGISVFFVLAGIVGIAVPFFILVKTYSGVFSSVKRLGLLIGAMLLLVAGTVSAMLIKEFRSNYRQKVEEQIEIAAYMEAEQIKNEDISSIKRAADYDGTAYKNISRIMSETLPIDIEFYQNIYCNILIMDEQKNAFAVAYLDQSIGDYYPLDETETEEVQQVYETGKALWNKEKEDISGNYIYIKVPVKNQAGDVTGVVAVGTELIVLDQILADIIKNILSVLVVLILLFCIFFEEVLSFLEEGKKYQEAEKETKKASPCHLMRLIIFGVFVAYNMTASFLPVYLMRYVQNAHFGNTELAASLPVTLNIFVIGATSLICQKLTVKLGIRKLAVLSGICSFAGNAMLFITPSYIAIVAGLLLDGIGVGFMTNAVYILISQIADSRNRMEGLAVYNSAYLAGINFGVMLGSLLAVQFGQRIVFVFVCAVWVILVGIIMSIGHALEPDETKEKNKQDFKTAEEIKERIKGEGIKSSASQKGIRKFLSDKAVSSFFILIQNPYIIFGSFVFYYVPLFCDQEGFSELASTLLLLLYAEIPVFMGNWTTKWMIEKLKYRSMYLACGINVLSLLVFVCYPKLLGMILALILMGLGACFGKPVQQMYFLDLESVKEYGEDKSIGIYNFTENIGESLGPVVFGQLMFISPLIRGVLPFCVAVTGMGGIYYLINRKKENTGKM